MLRAFTLLHKQELLDLYDSAAASFAEHEYSYSEVKFRHQEDNLALELPEYPLEYYTVTKHTEDIVRKNLSLSMHIWKRINQRTRANLINDLIKDINKTRIFKLHVRSGIVRSITSPPAPRVSLRDIINLAPSKIVLLSDCSRDNIIRCGSHHFFVFLGTFNLAMLDSAAYGVLVVGSELGDDFASYPAVITRQKEVLVFRQGSSLRTLDHKDLSPGAISARYQFAEDETRSMKDSGIYRKFIEGLDREYLPGVFREALADEFGKSEARKLIDIIGNARTVRDVSRAFAATQGYPKLHLALGYANGVRNMIDGERRMV